MRLLDGAYESSPENDDEIETPEEIELKNYFKEKPPKKGTNILEYWKSKKETYPKLSRLAKHFLCITATQASSERLFSVIGDVVSQKRSKILPFHAEQVCFLNQRFKEKLKSCKDFALL